MDRFFTAIATRSATIMGQPLAFILSTLFIILWAVSGPFLNYSDTWRHLKVCAPDNDLADIMRTLAMPRV
jgi:low affinity Fe/Cu permease